jgi:hypothetical protein
VALDVTRDERAERHYYQTLGARIVERCTGQPATQTHALKRLVDLGVEEGDPPSEQGVLGVACHLAVSPDLVTIFGWIVADLGVHLSSTRARHVAYHKMPSRLSRL